ncbi:hypothetical protein WP12_11485 [Sphingomonas sp. SRS2]|nr:hypothetical protein WP12_11485 [Sphingomonas sp. SRS2]
MGDVIGWKLDPIQRAELLRRFPPRWPDVVADHVTLQANAPHDAALPAATAGELVGRIDDGQGLQAMVVRIAGTTARPDGSVYHITWSLDRKRGRRAVESNQVLADHGWISLDEPIPLSLRPARF